MKFFSLVKIIRNQYWLQSMPAYKRASAVRCLGLESTHYQVSFRLCSVIPWEPLTQKLEKIFVQRKQIFLQRLTGFITDERLLPTFWITKTRLVPIVIEAIKSFFFHKYETGLLEKTSHSQEGFYFGEFVVRIICNQRIAIDYMNIPPGEILEESFEMFGVQAGW